MTKKQIAKTVKNDFVLLAVEVKIEVKANTFDSKIAYIVSPKGSISFPETKLEAAIKQYLKLPDGAFFVINSRSVVHDVTLITE